MLRIFGHAKVSVLNGGLKSWIAIGGATDSGPETPVALEALPFGQRLAQMSLTLPDLKTLVTDGLPDKLLMPARQAGLLGLNKNHGLACALVTFPGRLMFQSVACLKMARSKVKMTSLPLLPKEALILTVR